ncbi:MAG: response regulator [Rhizobiales bacterium]|nr:response regulator [Hyphomicrobiales bacterium]
MGLSARVAPYLPQLRRFSRALTGAQQSGDAYVAAVLEAVIEEPASLDTHDDTRIALYRLFCRWWESIAINLKASPPSGDPAWIAMAQKRLASLPPLAREAMLLRSVEGFSPEEISIILDRNLDDVHMLINQASSAIAEQMATHVMIIEDEPVIAMDLREIVESLGHTVTGVARTHRQAAELVKQKKPGLVLADIQLADGSSGIDAVNQILTAFEVPVIFITAFPERLLTGERPEPAFLITKPFSPEMVKAVISQALFFDTRARAAA